MSASACPTHRPSRGQHLSTAAAAGLIGLLVVSSTARAQPTDVKGSKDHPMISRYAGSGIIGHEFRKFDEFMLPLGPTKFQVQPPAYILSKSEKLEGRITRILYVVPPERTTLEVIRNYEQELKKGGFQTLFACAADCGIAGGVAKVLYPVGREVKTSTASHYAFTLPQEPRYLAAKRTNADGATHVSVLVAKQGNKAFPNFDRVVVLLDVIESAAMDTGMVTVDAGAMAKEIASSGHVALYGILFDTNKADVKAESQPALQEIAKLLKQDPALKLLVVGHTDNVGGFDTNLLLSQRRAAAVLQELTTTYGISATRLRPVGVGMAAPVAPNDTDVGRTKNRRVELVKQ